MLIFYTNYPYLLTPRKRIRAYSLCAYAPTPLTA